MKAATVRHTTCEKDFVEKSIKKGIRLDGRQAFDYRNIEIKFGVDYGCCEVQLGDTKAMAQVSSEIVKPVETRPTEGQLYYNLDLSPLASSAYEAGRMTDHGVEVNRLIERCLKESQPIDVESLCIVAGEKVWSVRVDILLMNDDGNVLDCCCIAAIAALSHFRRADITVTGTDIEIHPMSEREGVPLNVHHLPICTTFGFTDNGANMIVDPEEKEESIICGHLIMAFNVHMEVCSAQMSGGVSLEYEQIMQCAKIASIKAVEINDLIKEKLEEDTIRRAPVKIERREGLKDPPNVNKMKQVADIKVEEGEEETEETEDEEMVVENNGATAVQRLGKRISALGGGGESSWVVNEEEESDDDLDDCGYVPTPMAKAVDNGGYCPTPMAKAVGNSDMTASEEEDGYVPTAMTEGEDDGGYVPTPMGGEDDAGQRWDDDGYEPAAMPEGEDDNGGYVPTAIARTPGEYVPTSMTKPVCEITMDSEEEDIAILDPNELETSSKSTLISIDTNICDTPVVTKISKKNKKKKKKKKESVTDGST